MLVSKVTDAKCILTYIITRLIPNFEYRRERNASNFFASKKHLILHTDILHSLRVKLNWMLELKDWSLDLKLGALTSKEMRYLHSLIEDRGQAIIPRFRALDASNGCERLVNAALNPLPLFGYLVF